MIKVQAIEPIVSIASNGNFKHFSNSVNAAREHFGRKYKILEHGSKDCDEYRYFYQIQKFNVKKAIVTIKDETKRIIVTEGNTVLTVFRFKKANIASAKQHSRHFVVTLKF